MPKGVSKFSQIPIIIMTTFRNNDLLYARLGLLSLIQRSPAPNVKGQKLKVKFCWTMKVKFCWTILVALKHFI